MAITHFAAVLVITYRRRFLGLSTGAKILYIFSNFFMSQVFLPHNFYKQRTQNNIFILAESIRDGGCSPVARQ